MPPNPIADALRNLPTGMPGHPQQNLPGGGTPTGHLSRPITVGGSRLSLLARQLSTSADAQSSPPPPQPEPTYRSEMAQQREAAGRGQSPALELPRQNPGSFPQAPQQGGHGRAVHHSRRRNGGGSKLGLAAAFMLIAASAGAYFFKDQLRVVWERAMPPEPGLPSTVDNPVESPAPGVDLVATAPAPSPSPTPQDPPMRSTLPQPPSVSETASTQPSPAPSPLGEPPAPPRALPVTDPVLGGTVDPSGPIPGAVTTLPATPAAPSQPPMGLQTTRTPDHGMVASSASPSLVEIGRAKDDPSLLPKPDATPMIGNSDRPIIKNVPPACNAAVQGLKKFLAAPTWKERLQYMQLPEQMQRKAQIYYSTNQDGPVNVDEIRYLRHDTDPQIGKGMHVVFELASRAWDYTVPVMVEQHGEQARVDWLTFVEFKDDLLNKFITSYMDGPVRFHVGIRRSHYFEDNVPNLDQKDVFEVTTPMENVNSFVFTPKGTPLARSLASTLSWDKDVSWVVVELQWRKEGAAKWVELTAVPQLNWYSDGSTPESVSAPSSPVAVPSQQPPQQ